MQYEQRHSKESPPVSRDDIDGEYGVHTKNVFVAGAERISMNLPTEEILPSTKLWINYVY